MIILINIIITGTSTKVYFSYTSNYPHYIIIIIIIIIMINIIIIIHRDHSY